MKLDAYDRKILAALQRNGRLSNVNWLTRSACRRHLVCVGCGCWKRPG
jgi:DNA-binding Lrp family transcriptional regulator